MGMLYLAKQVVSSSREETVSHIFYVPLRVQWIFALTVDWDATSNEISVAPAFGWASAFHHQSTLIYRSVSLYGDLFKEEGARATHGEGKNKTKSYIRQDYCPHKAYNLFAQSKHEEFSKTARLSTHWVL